MSRGEKSHAATIALVGVGVAGVAVVGGIVLYSRRAKAAERVIGIAEKGADKLLDLVPSRKPQPVRTSSLPTPAPAPASDRTALGRVISSELERGTLAERLAIAYTTINRAQSRGLSLVDLVAPGGAWGAQGDDGRPFSSAQKASARSLSLASYVLAHPQGLDPASDAAAVHAELLQADPKASHAEILEAVQLFGRHPGAEPTGGAWAFWEPAKQDEFTAKGILYRSSGGKLSDKRPSGSHPELFRFRKYTRSAAAVRARWQADGQRLLPGVGRVELWTAPHTARVA